MEMDGPAAAGVVTQVVGRLGHIEPLDESTSDWPSYEERLSSFLQVNRIPEDDKVHAFLSLVGPKTYSLLKSLSAPELPTAKGFEASEPDFTEGFLALPQSQAGDQSTSEEPVPMEAGHPAPAPPSETPALERRYP
ncbi:hypothetical protein HPB52_014806 [Rhipicephalus sanguineus]|uniref:Uncharacterized protein n=1 Tax=Rhipicephalus sanguineus TaxID=34632 RepID=A0A9D4PEQ1_RHISA|nr:hypothetical protein HPB52_014806 [Rhipicephalus sanguineus]